MDTDYFQTSRLQLNALKQQLQTASADQLSVVRIATQMQQMQHMTYAVCEVLEEVLDVSTAEQAVCLVYIAVEILKRDPSPVNPYLSPFCLFFQRAYAKLQYSTQSRAQLREIADFMESSNLLPLGITKSLQTTVSRGFDSEMQEFSEAHASCVHFHSLAYELQKLVSQDWQLDGYRDLAAEVEDTTTEELRIHLQPRATDVLAQAIAGVTLCDSIIGGATQTRAAAAAARTALRNAHRSITRQIKYHLYCAHNFGDALLELLDLMAEEEEQDTTENEVEAEARAKKRQRRPHVSGSPNLHDRSASSDDGDGEDDDSDDSDGEDESGAKELFQRLAQSAVNRNSSSEDEAEFSS